MQNMKKIIILSIFLLSLLTFKTAFAQMGFNLEYLGNASAPQRPGMTLKYFLTYFNQRGIAANDIEVILQPQYYATGFTGNPARDMFQFFATLPIGYRRQRNAAGGMDSDFGIGSSNIGVEYYHRLIDSEKTTLWFDNGLVIGFPTATKHNSVRLGGNSFSAQWFQENFFKYKYFMATIMPIALQWNWQDYKTKNREGLSANIMNGSIGFMVTKSLHLGVDFGMILGHLAGSNNNAGAPLPKTMRVYTGPALLFSPNPDFSIQAGVAIDVATKRMNRGQGVFIAFWNHF